MAELNLSKYGITGTTEVVHNPSYDLLFEEETKSTNEGYEKGQVSELGAVNVMTGIYTGRSPKDKYIVMDENSKNTVWWTSEGYKNDNHPMTESTWASVKDLAIKELSNKKLYVVDAFCGANKDTRMAVRFIVEVAWQAHFVKNMFIQPSEEELKNFTPDFVVYNASKAKVENYKELGLNSETCVAFNITSREQVILNTWYGGEEITLFRNGTLQMALCWNIAQQLNADTAAAGQTISGDEIFPMAFPTASGDPKLCGGIWGFGIFDNGDEAKIKAAKTFIEFIAADPSQVKDSVLASTYFPVRTSVGDIYAGNEVMSEYSKFMGYLGDYYHITPGWTTARTEWWNMLQRVVSGEAVETAVKTFVDNANAAAAAEA